MYAPTSAPRSFVFFNICVGTVQAVQRRLNHNQPRILAPQRFGNETACPVTRGTAADNHDIRSTQQRLDLGLALRRGEIGDHPLFAAIEYMEPRGPAQTVSLRGFHFDHLCSQFGEEHCTERRSDSLADIQHSHAAKGSGHAYRPQR